MTATSPLPDDARCPCLSGETYGACCGRYHRGLAAGGSDTVGAPTAEALMRSRYAAFAVGDADYLLATWHPSTRPTDLDLDDDVTWRRLDVVATSAGGPLDRTGVVEFVAHYRSAETRERGSLHEVSAFVREGGRWYYVDGDVPAHRG
ncbi:MULTISPECIES: YchJ family protein [Oerskovia]|uniref:YchJ family protein n=1 Tax=Oerskovia TaxID=162491 RepID=UPI00296B35DA|nr:YchJ family metal-binding protein [Oerskovia rustica]